MIVLQARIPVEGAHREAVRRSLAGLVGPVGALPGCLRCGLFQDLEDRDTLLFVEEWVDMPSLLSHVRSGSMRVILSALDFARSSPEVKVLEVQESHGLDFIALAQQQRQPPPQPA